MQPPATVRLAPGTSLCDSARLGDSNSAQKSDPVCDMLCALRRLYEYIPQAGRQPFTHIPGARAQGPQAVVLKGRHAALAPSLGGKEP